ncbi:serine/threonine-protein kinase M1 [Elasticomyces elasticus]|nr:serine/threonine-protein kinase M1 [Elasticomyces elasticus]
MARKLPVPSQHAHPVIQNGHTNGRPPPSTLAAQIVQNRAGAGASRPLEDEEATFGQLLQEILNNTGPPETDIEVNCKLVTVVAEAGLDVLGREDPFAQWNVLISQALDSISVIDLTIERQPEILLHETTLSDNNGGPQVFLKLLPKCLAILGNSRCEELQARLKQLLGNILRSLHRSTQLWQHAYKLKSVYQECITAFDTPIEHDVVTKGGSQLQGIELTHDTVNGDNDLLPRKRRKIIDSRSQRNSIGVYGIFVRKLTKLFSMQEQEDLTGLHTVVVERYSKLSEADKCSAWNLLSAMPCLVTCRAVTPECKACCLDTLRYAVDPGTWDDGSHGEDWRELLLTVTRLLACSDLQRSTKPRVLAMGTVRSFARHTTGEHLDLASSELGQWCLRSLHSSLRELRVAAGRTLPVFLRIALPGSLRDKNRRLALDFLRTMSDRDELAQQETLILAWGQIARTCGEQELNLALLRLIKYLGHINPYVCALAFGELEALADTLEQSPKDLMKPFWRSIAITVVQDILSRPQIAQQVADFLDFTVNQFLVFAQYQTLPFLVLTKRTDILRRMALARGPNTSVQDICMHPKLNLAAILATLMAQSSGNMEETVLDNLTEAIPDFERGDLMSLVRLDPVQIACELLKLTGDADASGKPRLYQVIQSFAILVEHRIRQSKAASKPSRMLASFFEDHVLGILAYFSDIIETPRVEQSIPEKVRCLKALEEMILIAKTNISLAIPQIQACLQSAVTFEGIQDHAFSVWLTLASNMNGEDVVRLVDQLFSVMVQRWRDFSPEIQQRSYDTTAVLLKTHSTLIRETIMTIPSLAGIPLMSKFDVEITRLKGSEDANHQCTAFAKRLSNESAAVVLQALTELVPWMERHQGYIHDCAISEQPRTGISHFARALLDTTTRYSDERPDITILCAQCLGMLGCLDPNRIEATKASTDIMVLFNFMMAAEVIDWVIVLLEEVLIKAFKSATNARAQGFLAYTMQELLKTCGFSDIFTSRPRASQSTSKYQRWMEIPETVRNTLTPFLTSRYAVTGNPDMSFCQPYPIFNPDISYASWLRAWTFDLLCRSKGDNAQLIFSVLARIIRGHDISIASFVLPYAVLNVLLGGISDEIEGLGSEMLTILQYQPANDAHRDTVMLCSEKVFSVLDYMSRWMQEKEKDYTERKIVAYRTGSSSNEIDEQAHVSQVQAVEQILRRIPADVLARRAVDCRCYARALFHWERFMRQEGITSQSPSSSPKHEALYERLQNIYTQIDEPDGLEGISAHLHILNPEQQVLEHRRAGRWSAAHNWYEMELAKKPENEELQLNVLACLRDAGEYDSLLKHFHTFTALAPLGATVSANKSKLLPFAAQACLMTDNMGTLRNVLQIEQSPETGQDFDVDIAQAVLAMADHDRTRFQSTISRIRATVAKSISVASAASLQSSHNHLLKLHVLYEVDALSHLSDSSTRQRDAESLLRMMNGRLAVLGSYIADKQYVLGIRRAVMRASDIGFGALDIGSAWLTTARLARKANSTSTAYNAVMQASQLGDDAAKIEYARLLWKDGHHRQAIQNLEGAIAVNAFGGHERRPDENSNPEIEQQKQNVLAARANLLLAKWLDAAGQNDSKKLTARYQSVPKMHARWDKGHYYLGKHYYKLLEAEVNLPVTKQSRAHLCRETVRLVVENYLRSLGWGIKYWYQTVPKTLTLWLDLGLEVHKSEERDESIKQGRIEQLRILNRQMKKYFDKLPPYIWYMALPQIISRISHPHPDVNELLTTLITKIVSTHPSQALWSLFAVVKSTSLDRATRGTAILVKLKEPRKSRTESASLELRAWITHGQRLSDGLLRVCEAHIEPRMSHVSLAKDLDFSHKLVPSALVVPIESTLTASMPTNPDCERIRRHGAFSQDKVTIISFNDDVLVLSSLQRPRKLTIRGSDGHTYGLLCKPKDDLRKDQRLMEFNGLINRALKKDAESSKRRLYIKTYGVTPLSEESGIIEWVDGIKPMRDILLKLYSRKGVVPNYNELRQFLAEASADPRHVGIFTDKILPTFPPILHEYFVDTYPDPSTWFAARLRYARTAAVMSMVGHVLGLGDRHGENILLQESTGGVFHVDFNCLFDKGLTFEKPELVPFRLTHNMVDAMGAYGYEGPFRKSSELTLGLLRQYEDTLMTILETFVHDPTTDFIGKKKRGYPGVPETPTEVLDSIRNKLRGLLRGETVPLSVEGHVDALIGQATSPWNLCSMYIGWCAFF